MFKEFKEFAIKGNVLDMAVGIVIGAAFTTIVKSVVDDIIMPVIGKITGGVDFSNLFIVLGSGEYESLSAAKEAGAATINYGVFINSVVVFLIVAWVLFMIVKAFNKMKKQNSPSDPTEKECPKCFSKISIKATKCAHCTCDIAGK